MTITIIQKNHPNFRGDAWLVKFDQPVTVTNAIGEFVCKTKYFIVSGLINDKTEKGRNVVFVFPTNDTGEVLSWTEIAGGYDITHEQAIEELEKKEW